MLLGSAVNIDRTKATKRMRLLDVVAKFSLPRSGAADHDANLGKSLRRNYCFSVVIESIRKLDHAVPFVRYEIHTVSGETHEVPHPDFILVSPRGSYVVVIDPKDPREAPNHISALLIERATVLNGQKRPSRERVRNGRHLYRNGAFFCLKDFESLDLLLDFVSETGRAGAVYDAVIKRKRKRNDFRGFIFLSVWG